MSANTLVSLTRNSLINAATEKGSRIWLVKPPYFTPWTPPLGIAILKSFLEQNGYFVHCFDFNTDPDLWGMHHKYFTALQMNEGVTINDGYSKLWPILNAHMLAYFNGSDADICENVIANILPYYGIKYDRKIINALIPLIPRYFERLKEVADQVDLSEYSVVGTSTYTTSLSSSLFLLREIKQRFPYIKTVMGGGVFADDLALGSDNLETLTREYPFVDNVILGEGEPLLLKLLEGELADKRVISIADLKGATLDMKEVPSPNFSDLNLANYYHLTIEGARSCPFQCSFCSETIQWGDYRKKPMGVFAQQVIDLASSYNNNSFFMGDSLMNPYIIEFAKELMAMDAQILYDGYLRADKPVTNRERVKLWAQSGLYRVRLGLESASARVLKSMDKMTTPEVIAEGLKSLSSAGIRTTTYWIVGFPGETEEDFQETCDFIREHHPYIYEFEAHPYNYYPYGQVGSRLYESFSVFPDEVTDVIKFKVWDIPDVQPSREERFERLRRISKLASELGLPNIYTMADRYKAEDRWQLLHPLAVEVYEGTQLNRKPFQLPNHPLKIFSPDSTRDWGNGISKRSSILCYKAKVKKRLEENILVASIDQLIANNEVLHYRLENQTLVPSNDYGNWRSEEVFSRHQGKAGEESELLERQIVESLAEKMRPEPGASLKVALIEHEFESSEVLLLGHRALLDPRSIVLLFEDLFRIYKQKSNGRDVSLRPVKKSYSEFIRELTLRGASSMQTDEDRDAEIHQAGIESRITSIDKSGPAESKSIWLDGSLRRRILSKNVSDCGLNAGEVFLFALLKSLGDPVDSKRIGIDLTSDHRSVDAALEHTVCSLSRIRKLPSCLFDNHNLQFFAAKLREEMAQEEMAQELQQAGLQEQSATHIASLPSQSMLVNLEYFIDQPWLEGEGWTPEGFVFNRNGFSGHYFLEIALVLETDSIQVRFDHDNGERARIAVERVIEGLAREVEAILSYCEGQVAAREFWIEEFGGKLPTSNIEREIDQSASPEGGRARIALKLEKAFLEKVRSDSGAGDLAIFLAAYATLLSRMNGREDVMVLSSVEGSDVVSFFPFRLYPAWSQPVGEFIRQAEIKAELAIKHSIHAFDQLDSKIPASNSGVSRPIFDVGFVSVKSSDSALALSSMEQVFEPFVESSKGLALVLCMSREGENLDLQLVYESSQLRRETVERFGSCLVSIIEQASRNIEVELGAIALDGEPVVYDQKKSHAQDHFNF